MSPEPVLTAIACFSHTCLMIRDPAGNAKICPIRPIDLGLTAGSLANTRLADVKQVGGDRLLETHGRGPKQQRFVTDRNAALDWLSGVYQSRRRPESVATHLYGRTLHEVLRRFADRARTHGLRYAVTGAAAAQLLGTPVLSSLDVTQVRVGAVSAIEALASLELDDLTAEDGGRGSNLELLTDAGELGTYHAAEISGIHVAPAIRVWLDLARQGGRHSDAAQLFREQAIERAW